MPAVFDTVCQSRCGDASRLELQGDGVADLDLDLDLVALEGLQGEGDVVGAEAVVAAVDPAGT